MTQINDQNTLNRKNFFDYMNKERTSLEQRLKNTDPTKETEYQNYFFKNWYRYIEVISEEVKAVEDKSKSDLNVMREKIKTIVVQYKFSPYTMMKQIKIAINDMIDIKYRIAIFLNWKLTEQQEFLKLIEIYIDVYKPNTLEEINNYVCKYITRQYGNNFNKIAELELELMQSKNQEEATKKELQSQIDEKKELQSQINELKEDFKIFKLYISNENEKLKLIEENKPQNQTANILENEQGSKPINIPVTKAEGNIEPYSLSNKSETSSAPDSFFNPAAPSSTTVLPIKNSINEQLHNEKNEENSDRLIKVANELM